MAKKMRPATADEIAAYERSDISTWRCNHCGRTLTAVLFNPLMMACGECKEADHVLRWMHRVEDQPTEGNVHV